MAKIIQLKDENGVDLYPKTLDKVIYDYTDSNRNYGYTNGIQFPDIPDTAVFRNGLINLLTLYTGKRLRFYISYGGNIEIQIFEKLIAPGTTRFYFPFIRDYNLGDLFIITLRLDISNFTSWILRYDNNKVFLKDLTIASDSNPRILKILKIEVV